MNSRTALFIACFVLLLASVSVHAADAPGPVSPRQRLLMDFNWRFQLKDPQEVGTKFDYPEVRDLAKTSVDYVEQDARLAQQRVDAAKVNLGSDVSYVQPGFDDSQWKAIDLPHDWKVELPYDPAANFAEGSHALGPQWGTNIGWYRRGFDLSADDRGKALWVEFDGVFRNCLVWLNGHCLGRNISGYSSFSYDISKIAEYGGKNELVVRVDATRTEGWFYEGAGIYRHVWLVKTSPIHVAHWGTFVTNQVKGSDASTHIETTLENNSDQARFCTLVSTVVDADGKNSGENRLDYIALPPGGQQVITQYLLLHNVNLWGLQTPYLYKVISKVYEGTAPPARGRGGRGRGAAASRPALPAGGPSDQYETSFGIRTLAWDPDKGFFLNGQRVEIQGTCNHQDHAGVGMAIPDRLIEFRLEKLKELGCNAFRMSHNDPTPELLDDCDRLGMLVLDEHREMALTDEILGQIKRLVIRDRNHPSIFLWSIGNEEPIQGDDIVAPQVAKGEQDLFHLLDPSRLCTVPMSGGAGHGFTNVIDVQGFNYIHNSPNFGTFHQQFPTKFAIGTEEAAAFSTRGEYLNDPTRSVRAAYDTEAPGFGDVAEDWWPHYLQFPYIAGAFAWTGFDYRGEPTPFRYPAVSSQYGIMDLCGFPKDTYYYYQANWTDKPMVHLLPHWTWPDQMGKPIAVWAYSNCQEVELIFNGKSQGKVPGNRLGHRQWSLNYEPGMLEAKGYIGGKEVASDKVETTGAPTAVKLIPDRVMIDANGQDVSVVTVQVVDVQGRVCPRADNLVQFTIGGGRIIGVGNGDPASHESDKAPQRKAFNGLAQVIVQSNKTAGPIVLTARSDGLTQTSMTIQANVCPLPAEMP